jgi:hypothetical protein
LNAAIALAGYGMEEDLQKSQSAGFGDRERCAKKTPA